MNVPANLLYTATHEWVKIDGNLATLGITDHAQSELGDIVYVDLPNVGRALQAKESFGSIESVKTVSDSYVPFACEVVETNGALGAQPELINNAPYTDGWILKVKFDGNTEGLLDADAYSATIG